MNFYEFYFLVLQLIHNIFKIMSLNYKIRFIPINVPCMASLPGLGTNASQAVARNSASSPVGGTQIYVAWGLSHGQSVYVRDIPGIAKRQGWTS